MKPRGILMMEHRLIEKMIDVIREEIMRMEDTGKADPQFIDTAVDFIRIYADKTHHGKEEDILFRLLEGKKMDAEDAMMMKELIEDHKYGRKTVAELVEAKEKRQEGDAKMVSVIVEKLKALVDFYPEHICKEDDAFFPNTETLFSNVELQNMISEFYDFDKNMIHEKYKLVVDQLEKRRI
ncbi:hemerythrin domain-containing protein [Candidatus Sumerlaeota bacterium]|nr:hemerythrin domain-containing protein [Candidatus Sumerlaeota bacterium]